MIIGQQMEDYIPPPYQPRGRIPLWDFMKNLFNDLVGERITRSLLREVVYSNGYNTEITMDTYRNYLTQAGYLSIWKRGIYNVNFEIPTDLSLSDVRNEAYGEKGVWVEKGTRNLISCKTCKYGYHQKGCGYHDNILDGKKFCVDREYHDWEQYTEPEPDFLKESEMMI
jgi:hypothetical protein